MVVNSPSKRTGLGRSVAPANLNARPRAPANLSQFGRGSAYPRLAPSVDTSNPHVTVSKPRAFPANVNAPPKVPTPAVKTARKIARSALRGNPYIRVLDTVATIYQMGSVHLPAVQGGDPVGFTITGQCSSPSAAYPGDFLIAYSTGVGSYDDFANDCLARQIGNGAEWPPEVPEGIRSIARGGERNGRYQHVRAYSRPDTGPVTFTEPSPEVWLDPSVQPVPMPARTPRPGYNRPPQTSPLARPRTKPRTKGNQVPGFTIDVTPGGRVNYRPYPVKGRAGKGTKEVKTRLPASLVIALRAALEVTEFLDFLEIIGENAGLPPRSQDYLPQDMIYDLFVNGAIFEIDPTQTLIDLALNEVEDRIVGKVSGSAEKALRDRLGRDVTMLNI